MGALILKWGHGYLCILVLGVEKSFMQSLSAFYYFFGDKKKDFKSSFDLQFHPFHY